MEIEALRFVGIYVGETHHRVSERCEMDFEPCTVGASPVSGTSYMGVFQDGSLLVGFKGKPTGSSTSYLVPSHSLVS